MIAEATRTSSGGYELKHAKQGRAALFAFLDTRAASVNAGGTQGMWTPLHMAATESTLGAVLALLAAGADVSAMDGGYDTLLHGAATNSTLDLVLALLAAGAGGR